jgi:hypothetical protein
VVFVFFVVSPHRTRGSVLIVVVVMGGVPVPVVDVVDVVSVGHGDVAASLPVGVVVSVVGGVPAGFALVVMIVVSTVQMPIMDVVDVVSVGHGDVAASLPVGVVMPGVFLVRSGHLVSPSVR